MVPFLSTRQVARQAPYCRYLAAAKQKQWVRTKHDIKRTGKHTSVVAAAKPNIGDATYSEFETCTHGASRHSFVQQVLEKKASRRRRRIQRSGKAECWQQYTRYGTNSRINSYRLYVLGEGGGAKLKSCRDGGRISDSKLRLEVSHNRQQPW